MKIKFSAFCIIVRQSLQEGNDIFIEMGKDS